ncbi:UAP56-interacting factor-like [Gastrophryne carolinensis]
MEAMETERIQAEGEPAGSSTNIDMSLDDIIKLQKEESDTRSSTNPAGQNGRTRNFGSNRFFRGPPRNEQGLGRPKPGFRQQRFPNINTTNRSFGPVTRQRAAGSQKGVSPLHRPNTLSAQSSGQEQIQKQKQLTKRFRAPGGPLQTLTRRNNLQNRRPQMRAGQRQQRPGTVNPNKKLTQQVTINRGKRQLNAKRSDGDGFGTTLTVSVPNPKANRVSQAIKTGIKQPGGKFRKTPDRLTGRFPKGVPLRFNFRAMANHTDVTLNDRFSVLTVKGKFSPARRGGRTVTIT